VVVDDKIQIENRYDQRNRKTNKSWEVGWRIN